MRFTTLLPAPPTPTTLMVTTFSGPDSVAKDIFGSSLLFLFVSATGAGALWEPFFGGFRFCLFLFFPILYRFPYQVNLFL